MHNINIYDETYLEKRLHVQKVHQWDFNCDINWNLTVDTNKYLLPLDQSNIIFPGASAEQRLAISQFMGLIVASTISQLEMVAIKLKGPTWDKPLKKNPINPEFRDLGEQFYLEEEKHSRAFDKYIDKFASALDIESEQLRNFLPSANKTLIEKLYSLNAELGGSALWWLVAAVEEESLLFYNLIHNSRHDIDPLYYQIHRCHYEEESRHASYAPMMLEFHYQFSNKLQKNIFSKVEFLMAEVLNMTWTFNQLIKLKSLKSLKAKHPFFDVMYSTVDLLKGQSPLQVLHQLFTSAPYISSNLHLSAHQHVQEMLVRYGAFKMPLPETKKVVLTCTA